MNTDDVDPLEDVSLDIVKTETQYKTVGDPRDEDLNTRDKVMIKQSLNVHVKEEFCRIENYDNPMEDVSLDVVKTEPQYRTVRDVSGNTPDEGTRKQSIHEDVKEELCSKEDNDDNPIEDVSLDAVKTEPQISSVGDAGNKDLNTDEVIEKHFFNVDVKEELCTMEDDYGNDDGRDIRTAEENTENNQSASDNVTAPYSSYKCRNSYECLVCWKTFQNSTNLKIHQVTHTGERNYKCQICTKTFTQSSSLKTHQFIHTGEKKHECEVCGKHSLHHRT